MIKGRRDHLNSAVRRLQSRLESIREVAMKLCGQVSGLEVTIQTSDGGDMSTLTAQAEQMASLREAVEEQIVELSADFDALSAALYNLNEVTEAFHLRVESVLDGPLRFPHGLVCGIDGLDGCLLFTPCPSCCLEDTSDTGFEPVDADGDGYANDDDCDDADATVNPDAIESITPEVFWPGSPPSSECFRDPVPIGDDLVLCSHAAGDRFWVSGAGTQVVYEFEFVGGVAAEVRRISVINYPSGLALSPDETELYVSCLHGGRLAVS